MLFSKSSAIIAFFVLASISDQCLGGEGPWMKKRPATTTVIEQATSPSPTTVMTTMTTTMTTVIPSSVKPTVAELDTTTIHHQYKKKSTTEMPTTTLAPDTTTVKPTVAELDTTVKNNYPSKKKMTTPIPTSLAPDTTTVKPTVADLGTTTVAKPYPSKKRQAGTRYPKKGRTQPTPSPAALETTSVLLPTSTRLPATEATKSIETTKLIETTMRQESPPMKEPTTAQTLETTEQTLAPVPPSMAPAASKKTRRPKTKPSLPPVDFDCHKKGDGYFVDPKNKCSPIYYACVGGLARQLNCGQDDLVYEPETKSCEHRDDSFTCTGKRKTTIQSTLPPSQPTPVKLDIDCTKLDDGWYVDPTKKCSHVFYSCSNALGSKFVCPGQMYFDDDSKACLPYQDVVACAGTKAPTSPPTPTTPTTPKEKLPIDCTDKPSGQYENPEKKCSEIYYVCSNGDGIKRRCPDGTKFDVKSQMCDFFENVVACAGPKPPTTMPLSTASPLPSVASLLSNEYDCKGKPDVSYLPPSKKCSNHYYRCVGGLTYKAFCPRDLFYDIVNDLCDRWINLYVCSGKYPTSPLPTTPTMKPPVTVKNPIDCAKYPDGDYPDTQKKCSSIYYTCTGGLGVDISFKRQCPLGTVFDKDLAICDLRENVPACSGKSRPYTPKPTSRPKVYTTKSPYSCEKLTDGNYPAGKCQSNYWSCVGGSTIRADCPTNTYYDREMDECGHKEEIPDCGGVRPTEMIKTTVK
jgi:hypothetical protein